MKARGEKVYLANCAVCHQPNGKGGGPFPALDGSKIVNGPDAGQMHILLEGKGAMPVWKHLSDTELAAVMTFTRNNWGNHTGEVIQPRDFAGARTGKFPRAAAAPRGRRAWRTTKPQASRPASRATASQADRGRKERTGFQEFRNEYC